MVDREDQVHPPDLVKASPRTLSLVQAQGIRRMFLHLALSKLCLGTLPHLGDLPLQIYQRLLRMALSLQRGSELLGDSTPRDLISPTNDRGNWKNCLAFMKFRQTGAKSSSCKKSINATSFLISMMQVAI